MRISDWSSVVCSSDLGLGLFDVAAFTLYAFIVGEAGRRERLESRLVKAHAHHLIDGILVQRQIKGLPHACILRKGAIRTRTIGEIDRNGLKAQTGDRHEGQIGIALYGFHIARRHTLDYVQTPGPQIVQEPRGIWYGADPTPTNAVP